MRAILASGLVLLAWMAVLPAASSSQAVEQRFLAVGEMAPDFELPGATRYGVLARPVRLSDYRGDTVVLAFFYRVRGGG